MLGADVWSYYLRKLYFCPINFAPLKYPLGGWTFTRSSVMNFVPLPPPNLLEAPRKIIQVSDYIFDALWLGTETCIPNEHGVVVIWMGVKTVCTMHSST